MAGRVGGAAERDDHDQGAGAAGADRGRAPVEALVDPLHDGGLLGLDDDGRAGVGAEGLVRAIDGPGDRAGAASAAAITPAASARVSRWERCLAVMAASFKAVWMNAGDVPAGRSTGGRGPVYARLDPE